MAAKFEVMRHVDAAHGAATRALPAKWLFPSLSRGRLLQQTGRRAGRRSVERVIQQTWSGVEVNG